MTRSATSVLALTVWGMVCPVSMVFAEPGLETSLTVSQGVKSVNRTGRTSSEKEGVSSTTSLDFGLTSTTASQRFDVKVGTELDYGLGASSGNDFSAARKDASLGYSIESRTARFKTDLSYRNVDIEDSVFLDELTGKDVVADNGRRELLGLTSSLMLGRDTPLSFELDHSYQESSYTDTTDSDLLDSTSTRASAALSFELSPVLTLEARSSYSDYSEDGPLGDQLTTRTNGIGATYQLSPGTSVSAEVNYSSSTTEDPADDSSGVGYNLSLSHDMPNGSVEVALSAANTVNGTRNQVSLGRSLEFGWGKASLSVGASQTGDFSVRPLVNGTLHYAVDKLSALDVNLSQTSFTGSDNDEIVRTQLSVGYQRELTDSSRLSSSLQLSDRTVLGSSNSDQSVMRMDLSYAHEVGADWSLVSGYQYSKVDEQIKEDRTDSTVFLKLEKTFAFRP